MDEFLRHLFPLSEVNRLYLSSFRKATRKPLKSSRKRFKPPTRKAKRSLKATAVLFRRLNPSKHRFVTDTERPDDEAYANSFFLNANSTTQPGIVDANVQPILTRSEVYSGVYGRASINFYAFNSNGNRGIACGLNNLQKIRDGEPLGSRTSAEDDFADFAEDDDFLS
jgi:hypothetical protein